MDGKLNAFALGMTIICLRLREINSYWTVPDDECQEWEATCIPTISSIKKYNPKNDVSLIYAALEGRDIKILLNIIPRRSFKDRAALSKTYHSEYNKRLTTDMKHKLPKSTSKKLLKKLLTSSLDQHYIHELEMILGGKGPTKLRQLMDILGALSQKALTELFRYNSDYKKLLSTLGKLKLEQDALQFILDLTSIKAETSEIDYQSLNQDISDIISSVATGTVNYKFFLEFALKRGNNHLRNVYSSFRSYAKDSYAKYLLASFATKQDSIYELLYDFFCITNNRVDYFAERLYESLFTGNEEKPVDEAVVQRLIIGRSEIDLETIKQWYGNKYGNSLAEHIQTRFKSAHKVVLLKMLEYP